LIDKKAEVLAQASAGIAQRANAAEQGASAGGGAAGGAAGGGQSGGGASGREDVVDAEFEEVKDKDRKAS
jgi:molecular chaperone DnaK